MALVNSLYNDLNLLDQVSGWRRRYSSGKPKYYCIMVYLKLSAWKSHDGRQGGIDVLDYSVKGYVSSNISNYVSPPSGEFQVKVEVYVDSICKLNKKYSMPQSINEITWYYEAGLGMHTVRLLSLIHI